MCREDYLYQDAGDTIYLKLFQKHNLKLLDKLLLGFFCPNEEFRSLLCQLMYEQLTTAFEFSEDPIKPHSFIKLASWASPIVVMGTSNINLVNTICSIASYYEVGLEVIRTDNIDQDFSNPEARLAEANLKQDDHQPNFLNNEVAN